MLKRRDLTSLEMNPQKEPNLRSAKIKAAYPTFRKDAKLISLVFYCLGAIGVWVAVLSFVFSLSSDVQITDANTGLPVRARLFPAMFFGGLSGIMCIALGSFISGVSRMMAEITDGRSGE